MARTFLRTLLLSLGPLAAAATVPALEWEKRFGGSQDESIGAIANDPGGNIYVAGTTTSIDLPASGAFRQPGTSNLRRVGPAGAVELLRGPLAGNIRAMTIAQDTLYVASTAGVMFTRNNGTTWSILPTGAAPKFAISNIAVEPSNPAVIYLVAGGLWKTSDAGKNWAQVQALGEFQGGPAQVYSVTIDPRRPGTIYTTGSAGAFRSGDGGASWARLPDGISSIAFDPGSSGVVYTAGYPQLRISDDAGLTWKPLPRPGTFDPVKVIADPTHAGTIYVQSGNVYYRSADRGQNWTRLPAEVFNLTTTPDAPILYAVDQPYGASALLQSRDGGDTWTKVAENLFRFELANLIVFRGTVFLGSSTLPSAFVAKFGSGGDLLWSTYLPGSRISAITTGFDQSVYFAAFCMKPAALEASPCTNDYSSYVGKLSPDGQRLLYAHEYSTGVYISSIAVDAAGSAHITGSARGRIPTTAGSLWPDPGKIPSFFPNEFSGRIFATKFSQDGSALIYSTYLGDWATSSFFFPIGATPGSIVVERSGHAIIAGPSIWKLGPLGNTLDYSTKIGDRVSGGVLDSSDHLYAIGIGTGQKIYTSPGSHLPAATGPSTGFITGLITRLSPAGEFLESTLLGPASGGRIALGADDSVLVSSFQYGGATKSLIASTGSGFVVSLDASLSTLRFATPLEGIAEFQALPKPDGGIAVVRAEGNAAVFGDSPSGSDVVIRAYRWVDSAVRIDAILNAASAAPGPLAPGELVIIRGAGMGQAPRVRAGDVELRVVKASESELWVVVPDDVMSQVRAPLIIETDGKRSQQVDVGFTEAAPAIFTADGSGAGQALALNEDGTLNSAANPARRGSVLGLAVNGMGKHRLEGSSVVLRREISVIFDNTYAYGVDSNLFPAPGIPVPVVVVKIFVPQDFPFASSSGFPRAVPVWIRIVDGDYTQRGPTTVWVR